MFKIKDTVYSDAGYILLGYNKKGYQFEGELSEFKEEKISLDNVKINNNLVIYDGIVQMLPNKVDYASLKKDMVKRRYSVDDQIAIILNKDESDEDMLKYEKMQEWREWSAKVAKLIINNL